MSQFNKRAITELFCKFTKKEIKEFKDFVAYKEGKSLVALWETLHPAHPKYNIDDKEVYDKIRPKQAFNDGVYRSWVADLAKCAKEFIAYQEFKGNELLFNNTLNLALIRKGVEKMGKKSLGAQVKLIEKQQGPDAEFYAHNFQHQDLSYQYVTLFDHRGTTNSLQKASDSLDHSFLVQKLKYLCLMRNRSHIVTNKDGYRYKMEAELLEYLDNNAHEELPLLQMYYLMLKFMRDLKAHKCFYEFLGFFKAHHQFIAPSETRQLSVGASNYCLWNIRLGHLKFLKPRMELAILLLEEKLIIVEGKISPYHFDSLVGISIEAGMLSWCEKFIEEYLSKTDKKNRPSLEATSRAYLHFAKGEYENQACWMQKMENQNFSFMDINSEIVHRMLKLKTSYVLLGPSPKPMANNAFHAQLDAFRNYLINKRTIPQKSRIAARNFKKAMNQLHQKKQGKNLKVGDLRTYILGLQPIRELPWLLGEVKRLED